MTWRAADGWRQVLALEDVTQGSPEASKNRAIREVLGITPTQYRRRLLRSIEYPDAQRAYPTLTGRLLRLRDAHRLRRWPGRIP